tara:strand:+ start:26854 stop:27051 length:198 start_codon:yes stop_codon:yes gene_type:complete
MAITIPKPAARPDYYSSEEFGQIFNRSRRWVQVLIREGKIRTKRVGTGSGQLFIPSDQIETLLGD